jgi:hypothetical protein
MENLNIKFQDFPGALRTILQKIFCGFVNSENEALETARFLLPKTR